MAPIILAKVERSSMRLTEREFLRNNTRKVLRKRQAETKGGKKCGLKNPYKMHTKKEMKIVKYIKKQEESI